MDHFKNKNNLEELLIDYELGLHNVTLKSMRGDIVLQSVSLNLPKDQTVIIQSSVSENAILFLKYLAQRIPSETGHFLIGDKDLFSDDSIDFSQIVGSYFDIDLHNLKLTVREYLLSSDFDFDLVQHFSLETILDTQIKDLHFAQKKLINLIHVMQKGPEILIMEDPATGLSDSNWLNLLDFMQFMQRRACLRHIFMTNHHPLAIRQLSHNLLYLEDGMIYFDAEAGYKKVSHF